MRCRDFSAVLGTFADVLGAAGASVAQDQIATFAAVFDAHALSSVSSLANRLAALHGNEPAGSPNLGDIARLLSALKSFLDKIAKTAVLADINALEKLLHSRSSMELLAFVRMATEAPVPHRPTRKRGAPAVRDDLVVHYKERLEAALGDEEKFSAVYNDLRANTAIRKPEILALARQMTGGGARTDDAALKKIWNRHRSLVVFNAKARATGGRSAA